jgi:hypothetical protein
MPLLYSVVNTSNSNNTQSWGATKTPRLINRSTDYRIYASTISTSNSAVSWGAAVKPLTINYTTGLTKASASIITSPNGLQIQLPKSINYTTGLTKASASVIVSKYTEINHTLPLQVFGSALSSVVSVGSVESWS